MIKRMDLDKIEKKAWKAYYAQDGLIDIFFGIMILVGAIRTITDIPWLILGILAGVIVIPVGKRYITTPRIGMVKFGKERVERLIVVTVGIGIAVGITSLVFFFTVYTGEFPKIIGSFLMVVMIVGVFSLMAYLLDHIRLFFYGLFMASGEFVRVLYGRTNAAYYDMFLGVAFLFIGFFVLVRFVQKYPKPSKEAHRS